MALDGLYPYYCEACDERVYMAASIGDGAKDHGFIFACGCTRLDQHMGDESKPDFWQVDFGKELNKID